MARRNPSRARAEAAQRRRREAGGGRRKIATPSRPRADRPTRRPQAAWPPASGLRPPLRSVRIHNGCPRLRLDRRAVAAVISLLDAHAAQVVGGRRSPFDSRPSACPGVPRGGLSLVFLTETALARLHAEFLGDRSPTDVITFAGTPSLGQAGEICVSADAARAFAQAHGRDFSAELTLYLVHGWLHLAGHDDRRPAAKRRMRAAEARAMALLRATRALPRFRLAPVP